MAGRTKLTVAYLGAAFSGWQRQRATRTVQGELERAITELCGGRPAAVVGAGRTDAGVHAAAQVAHVDLPAPIPPAILPRLLNARLDTDLRLRSARPVAADFHARRDALGKHYAYRIRWREPDLPWVGLRCAVVPAVTERDAVEDLCRRWPGRRDWSSFTVPEVARRGAVRTIFSIEPVWRTHGLDLHVVGEGFLRYQVRRMVGALLAVGHGLMDPGRAFDLVVEPFPGAPLTTAPGCGLSLERVYYRASPRLRNPAESGPSL